MLFDHVPFEITALTEGSSARLARMILFSRVGEHMFDQVTTPSKGLVAHITPISLNASMSEHVLGETNSLSE